MTTKLPDASAHSVITGFYEPNNADKGAKLLAGFGTTNVLVAPTDCNNWQESQGSLDRIELFTNYSENLGI